MKDHCPQCGLKFGFNGPNPEVNENNELIYHCPKCGAKLKRQLSMIVRVATIVGFLSLLVAAVVTLIEKASGDDLLENAVHFDLYLASIIGFATRLILGFTRQHYVLLK